MIWVSGFDPSAGKVRTKTRAGPASLVEVSGVATVTYVYAQPIYRRLDFLPDA